MNKLQLYITLAQDDFRSMVEINPDSYVQSWVTDLRPILRQVAYPTASKAIFYLLKYIDSGVFITVVRTIPKQPLHHVAAWIFIPYSLRVSNANVWNAVQFITQKISNSEVRPKDIDEMSSLLGHAYEEDLQAPSFPASSGLNVAYRYYGARVDVSLSDLLGRYRYQTAYLPFAAVWIIDENITNDISGTNLSSAPLEDMAVLFPPETPNADGYKPYIYDEVFDMAYYVPMGRNIDITWRKADDADLKQTIYVSQPEMRAPDLNLQRHAMAPPSPSAPEHQTPAQSAPPVTSHQGASAQDSSDVPSRKKTYHFQIPAKSASIGTVIEFEITTNNELDGSPIDGYEPTAEVQEGAGRSNHLLYKADNIRQKIINNSLYALGGFVVGILVALISTCDRSRPEPAPAAQPQIEEETVVAPAQPGDDIQGAVGTDKALQQTAEPAATDRSLEAAVKYLDSNQTWTRQEMEQFPDLQGLYADMNKIDRRRLVDVWGPKLKASRAFTNQIVHHSKLSYKKKARKIPYNAPGDPETIRIQNYLNTIDP